MNCPFASKYSLYFAWLITLIALMGSLYSSVILHLPVCDLCWYQRICIYPLVIILGIAAYREDFGIVKYAMPLAVIGGLFALYQYLEQMIPGFAPIALCGVASPDCSAVHFKGWGFITFPLISLIGCLGIIFSLLLAKRAQPIPNS